jgi:plasmid stabilization system protein ParE
VSNDAHIDIDEIINYIANHLMNLSAADAFLDAVERCYHSITDNPFMYSLSHNKRLRRKGYRIAVIKNYLLFYRVDETEQIIYIIRVIYGARDYTALL